jgi:hypothetical protein
MRSASACGAVSTSTSSDGNSSASRASGSLHARRQQLGRDGQRQAPSSPWCSDSACACRRRNWPGHLPRLRFQRARRFGRPHFARTALEQLQVQLRLQLGDRHADGGRHPSQRPRRSGERAVIQHGEKDCNVIAGEGHAPILSEKLIAVDFFDQKISTTMRLLELRRNIMQGLKRKVIYATLFELIAVALTSSLLMLLAGHDAGHAERGCDRLVSWSRCCGTCLQHTVRGLGSAPGTRGRSWLRRARARHRLRGRPGGDAGAAVRLVAGDLAVAALVLDLWLVLFFMVYTFCSALRSTASSACPHRRKPELQSNAIVQLEPT